MRIPATLTSLPATDLPVQSVVLIFRFAKQALRLFPLATAPILGRLVGAFASRFFPRELAITQTHAEYVRAYLRKQSDLQGPEASMPFPEAKHLAKRVFMHLGEAVGEALIIDQLLERDTSAKSGFRFIASEGQEIVKGILAGGNGCVALSGHIGCFELLAAFHSAYGVPISVIARNPNYETLGSVVREMRSAYGVEIIWRDDPSTSRRLLSALRSGRVVAVLIDQDTALDNAFSPFFGVDAAYPSAPIRLAIKQRLPIISSFIVRTAPQRHCVITKTIDYDPEAPDAVAQVLATFSRHLEELILRYPDQWLWWHRRWRRRPGVDYRANPEALQSTERYLHWMKDGPA